MHQPSFAGTDGETVISRGDALLFAPRSGTGRTRHLGICHLGIFCQGPSPRLSGPMGLMAKSEIVSGMPRGTEDAR
jgi:hypothetical protein